MILALLFKSPPPLYLYCSTTLHYMSNVFKKFFVQCSVFFLDQPCFTNCVFYSCSHLTVQFHIRNCLYCPFAILQIEETDFLPAFIYIDAILTVLRPPVQV